MKTLIIIPCYNEAARLHVAAFEEHLTQAPTTAFLFVNDGSQDKTPEIINRLATAHPSQIFALHLSKNAGKAEAVRQGFLRGFTLNPEFIGYLDADLAAPLSCLGELEHLLAQTGRQIAMGSRVRLLGHTIERPASRHFAGRVFATLASWILNLKVYDTQCGAKLFRVTAPLQSIFEKPFQTRWIFDVEILARFTLLTRQQKTVDTMANMAIEYPLWQWHDQKGSRLKPKDFLTSGLDLLKILAIVNSKKGF